MSTVKRKLNYRFSHEGHKVLSFAAHHAQAQAVVLPPSVDLRPKCPPIYDQGEEGSCSAHAGVAHFEFLTMMTGVPRVAMSRQFLYSCERIKDGDFSEDAGAEIIDIAQVLSVTGVCPETLWPYVQANMYKRPTPICYQEAAKHKIANYYAIKTPHDMKVCLALGFPFVFGMVVPEVMMSDDVERTGVLPNLNHGELTQDGHAVMCVGYDLAKKVYIIRNSWGTSWGQQGYFTIPFSVMEDPNWVSDCYTFRLLNQKGM